MRSWHAATRRVDHDDHTRRPCRPARTRCPGRPSLPIRRVVGPADVATLAVHIMTNTALTGATYDIDGGQQLVPGV